MGGSFAFHLCVSWKPPLFSSQCMSEIFTIPAGVDARLLCPDVDGRVLDLHGWGLLDAETGWGWGCPVALCFLSKLTEERGNWETWAEWVCDGQRDQYMRASTNSSWRLLGVDSLWETEDYCEVYMRKNMSGKKKSCFAGIPSGDLEDFVLEKTLSFGL